MIYWFTGQPGHGKTTLAKALIAQLKRGGYKPYHIDGDDLRSLTTNNDYSRVGREANIREAQDIAHYLHTQGEIVVRFQLLFDFLLLDGVQRCLH